MSVNPSKESTRGWLKDEGTWAERWGGGRAGQLGRVLKARADMWAKACKKVQASTGQCPSFKLESAIALERTVKLASGAASTVAGICGVVW